MRVPRPLYRIRLNLHEMELLLLRTCAHLKMALFFASYCIRDACIFPHNMNVLAIKNYGHQGTARVKNHQTLPTCQFLRN